MLVCKALIWEVCDRKSRAAKGLEKSVLHTLNYLLTIVDYIHLFWQHIFLINQVFMNYCAIGLFTIIWYACKVQNIVLIQSKVLLDWIISE